MSAVHNNTNKLNSKFRLCFSRKRPIKTAICLGFKNTVKGTILHSCSRLNEQCTRWFNGVLAVRKLTCMQPCQSHIDDAEANDVSAAVTALCTSAGPGTAPDGSGERWTAHHIFRAAHHGAGHVRGSGSNYNAGSCVWSSRSTAGKIQNLVPTGRSSINYYFHYQFMYILLLTNNFHIVCFIFWVNFSHCYILNKLIVLVTGKETQLEV